MTPDQQAKSSVLGLLSNLKQQLNRDLTEVEIVDAVDHTLSGPYYPNVDRDDLITEVRESVTTWSDDPGTLEGDAKGHEKWFTPEKRESIDWHFWNRYRSHLLSYLPLSVVQKGVDQSTNTILGLLEDPHREGLGIGAVL